MNPCGICGCASPPKDGLFEVLEDGLFEVLEIVHVASGLRYFRCRKDMAVGLTEAERSLIVINSQNESVGGK